MSVHDGIKEKKFERSYWDQFEREATNESFWMGIYEGIKAFAWWKDGIQYVGSTGKTLKETLEEIEKMRYKWERKRMEVKNGSTKTNPDT